jgi:hypothetical protein
MGMPLNMYVKYVMKEFGEPSSEETIVKVSRYLYCVSPRHLLPIRRRYL